EPHPTSHYDNTSVSSQHVRKRNKIFHLSRSSSSEPKVKKSQTTEATFHHLSTVSTEYGGDIEYEISGTTNTKHAVSSVEIKSPPSNDQPSAPLTNQCQPPVDLITLPAFGSRVDATPQLALCIGLLTNGSELINQEEHSSQDLSSGTAAQLAWIKSMKQDPVEQERLCWLGARMVDEFAKDASKDSIKIAEMVLIGPVLDSEHYRRLLSCTITAFDQAMLLDIDLLQGLVQLVQSAPSEALLPDDLVKILRVLRIRLQDTHQQSSVHPFHLTLAVSRLLDVMAEHKAKDLDRVEDHEPLSGMLSGLKASSDPYLMYQACYAFQALQYVPINETPLQTVLRHSTGAVDGLFNVTAVFNLNLRAVLEGLSKLQYTLGEVIKVVGTAYNRACSLMESGRGVLESMKEGLKSGQKHPWYAAIRVAYCFAQGGQLRDLNTLIYEAPCRRDPLFQWGICQLLGEIVSDSIWDTGVRLQAIDLLGELYRNDPLWGQDESVRTWMLNIIRQFGAAADQHRLWTDYRQGGPIPLFINLPAISHPDQELIAKHLKTNNFSDDQIQEIKQHRQLILICDGYDESQQLTNLHRTNMLNQPGQWNTKMVISCRTQFLGPSYGDRFKPQPTDCYAAGTQDLFQEVVIAPFSKEQIENYVELYEQDPQTALLFRDQAVWSAKEYMDKLTTIPNIKDLVKNTFLLTIALKALPRLAASNTDLSSVRVTRVGLYDMFVDQWLDTNRLRLQSNTLSKEELTAFNSLVDDGFIGCGITYLLHLSAAIFQEQDGHPVVQYIHRYEKDSWKAPFFGTDPEIKLLRDASPLMRTGNQYRFIHRSMLEYFLSRIIYNPVKVDEQDFDSSTEIAYSASFTCETNGPMCQRNLLEEPSVIQFLCDRVMLDRDFEQQLRAVIDQSKTDSSATMAATNAITILVKAG
ncbi:hypothetical protein BGZ90_004772, partial [Linnemannia elongata]